MVASIERTEETPEQTAYRKSLIANLAFEIIPLKSVDDAIAALPPGATVSVTCSPAKGIETTQRLTEEVQAAGHDPIPHLSARMAEGPEHARSLASWLRSEGIDKVFIVGGDADPPAYYSNATDFMADLIEADPGVSEIGVTSYPDGHALIPQDAINQAVMAKQALLNEAGIAGWASTQMCFDPKKISSWLEGQRSAGMDLPIKLGLAGVIDRTKLVTMGTRLGIGTSLGFLRKNRKAVGSLLSRSSYDPNDLLLPLSSQLAPLGVTGIHCFTFNQVASTETWRQSNV